MLKTLLFIGMGSFTGGVLRYLISRYVQNFLTPSFPLGTMYSVVSPSACFTDSSNGEI
jgi:CrcB protein